MDDLTLMRLLQSGGICDSPCRVIDEDSGCICHTAYKRITEFTACADRLEAQEALLREAMCGLSVLLHVYDGVPMNPIEAERRATEARATLAKLRAHLEGEKE